MLPIESDEMAKLLEELNVMKNALAQLLEEREFMIVYDAVRIEADYMKKIGHEEFAIYRLDIKLKKLKRKIEIIKSLIRRKEPIDLAKIDAQIEEEFSKEKQETHERQEHMEYLEEEETKEKLSKAKSMTLKELYYKLAKKLHPDINPNVTEKELALWHRVQTAYNNADIEEMILLYEIYEKTLGLETELNTKEEILKRIEKIRGLIKDTLAQIADMKQNFPFNVEQQLNDEDWLFSKKAVNRELKRQLNEEYSIAQDLLRMMLSSVGMIY